MTSRHIMALAIAALASSACNASHTVDGEGVCCPFTDFTGCSPGDPRPAGGWAPSLDGCTRTISGYDGAPFVRATDEHGCVVVTAGTGCCGCIVPPPPEPPPPPPVECEGLGVIDCLGAGCLPTYDDECCSSCSVGGCADCTNWEYYLCRPFEDACMGMLCSLTSPWGCGGAVPDCSRALRSDVDSCDIAGCVPATAPVGFMDPTEICVPITASSCTVSCRRLPPECPAGTVPESDGFCYTDRCIPAWICG